MSKEQIDNNDENLVNPEVLKKINQDLEKEILSLHNKISNSEKQNEILLQNLEKAKLSDETIAKLQNENIQLNNKISDLEEDNTILVDRNKKLNVEDIEKSSLQDKIKELEESIISLEKVNKIHRDNIDQLRAEKFTEVNKLENDIEGLNAMILNLEEEKDRLPEVSKTLADAQPSKITELEYKINEQTAYISFLEDDNTELRKKVKEDQDRIEIDDLKQNIHRLQKKIANFEKENNNLNEKNQVLKTALLLHIDTETKEINNIGLPPKTEQIQEEPEISQTEDISIKTDIIENNEPTQVSTIPDMEELKEHEVEVPKGFVQELIKKRNTAMEDVEEVKLPRFEDVPNVSTGKVQELVNKRNTVIEGSVNDEHVRVEEEPEISTGKVQDLINRRHVAMEEGEKEELINAEDEPTLPPKPPITQRIPEKEQEVLQTALKSISKIKTEENSEESNLDSIGVIVTQDGKRKCPICNNQNHRLIREVEDKSRVINAYPKMYGKKFKCGQCGAEWR
jgi:predicted RNase H-like nuclease (RuvC/YqgF family)